MNRHCANPGDVFVLLVLCEVLGRVRPVRYAETHAGSPTYPLAPRLGRPGSAAQAMHLLGDECDYLLCDVDPESARELREQAESMALTRCLVTEEDGMVRVARWDLVVR